MKKRVVTDIRSYLEPARIYKAIHLKPWQYSQIFQESYACRDRAMMAMCYVSAGRISEVVGGPHMIAGKVVGKHPGLRCGNLKISERYILVQNMPVVKRSQKLIKKHGKGVTLRDDFAIPLQRGLFKNPFWDQLVPFGWILYEYLKKYSRKRGKIWPYQSKRAYQIIRQVTGKFPHWFRAQAEHFYGHYLLADTIKLAKFVKVMDLSQVKHYIGYSWNDGLKDIQSTMNFDWIDPAVQAIKERLKK